MQRRVLSSISNKQLVLMTWLAKLEVFGAYRERKARYWDCMSSICPSVRPSVTLVDQKELVLGLGLYPKALEMKA